MPPSLRPEAILDSSATSYFFVVDRVAGDHLLTMPCADSLIWVQGIDKSGRPVRNPEKDASPGGSLVLPDSDGIINWEPPTYDPQTGLFYRTEPNVGAQPESCSSVATLTGTHAPWPAKL